MPRVGALRLHEHHPPIPQGARLSTQGPETSGASKAAISGKAAVASAPSGAPGPWGRWLGSLGAGLVRGCEEVLVNSPKCAHWYVIPSMQKSEPTPGAL